MNLPSAKDIFLDAIELPADQREAFVRRACGDEEPLLRCVNALLASHREAGRFMERPFMPRRPHIVPVQTRLRMATKSQAGSEP